MNHVHLYKHIPGGSCACVAWSNVLRHSGYDFSEADIFGLGGGYFFGYFAIAREKEFNITLLSPGVINNLFQNIGVYAQAYHYSNEQLDLEKIKTRVDNGFPVALQLNPLYINELTSITDAANWPHLPAHWVTVTGYDDTKKIIRFYDNRQFNPIEMSFEDFYLARGTGNNTQNPKRLSYEIVLPAKLPSLEESILLSLKKTCLNHLDNSKYLAVYNGDYGMDKLARQFNFFKTMLSHEQLINTMGKIMVSITGAGGVKGAYRFLFSQFLKKGGQLFNNNHFDEFASEFKVSGVYWTNFNAALKKIISDPSNPDYFDESSELLTKIHAIETTSIRNLKKVIDEL